MKLYFQKLLYISGHLSTSFIGPVHNLYTADLPEFKVSTS